MPRHHKTRRRRHGDYEDSENDDDDEDYSEDEGEAPPPPPPAPPQMTDEEKSIMWQNPEHPERRQGRYSGGDDEQTEFVRTEYTDMEYKKLRTYSEFLKRTWNMRKCCENLKILTTKKGSLSPNSVLNGFF